MRASDLVVDRLCMLCVVIGLCVCFVVCVVCYVYVDDMFICLLRASDLLLPPSSSHAASSPAAVK